jgi:hypothetical protein
MSGSVELPVPAESASGALDGMVAGHPRLERVEKVADGVEAVGWVKDPSVQARVRLSVRPGGESTSVLAFDADGGDDELRAVLVDDLVDRVRTEVARALAHGDETATGAYVGTVVGGHDFDLEPGRVVAVVFGQTTISLRYAGTSVELGIDQLAEVAAVPTSTAGLPVDAGVLEEAVAHARTGTVLGIATSGSDNKRCLIHIGGTTTTILNAELDHLRTAMQPAALALLSRPAIRRSRPSPRVSPSELVRQMTALAQLHHAGDLTEREWAEAKAKLLGID